MALRPYIGFVGPSYTSQSRIAAYDRTVNWYPERIESGTGNAGARYALYPTPGFFVDETGLDSPGRAGISDVYTITGPSSTANSPFFLSGRTLYELSNYTVRATGIGSGGTTPASLIWSGIQGHQILISADGISYCYDTTSHALTTIGVGASIAFSNSYGIRVNSVANEFYFSAPFDFSSWNALDVVPREDAQDNWLAVLSFRDELWFFGERTTSIYYNDGDSDIPWKPNESAFIQKGVLSPYSVCVVDGAPMWLGRDESGSAIVYRASGYTPVRVSTHAVEFAMQSGLVGQVDIAEACSYQMNGHSFYELTLPSNSPDQPGGTYGSTWVYDVTEGLWHERGERNGLQFQEMDTRGYFGGLTLSRSAGTVYIVSTNINSTASSTGTNGDPIVRLRRAPHINHEQRRTRYSHLRLVTQPGNGLGGVPSTTVGFNPNINLSWSDDGGQTFGTSYPASTGPQGAFDTLVEWRQLGQARDRVFEMTWSAPVFRPLIDAFIDYSVGPS